MENWQAMEMELDPGPWAQQAEPTTDDQPELSATLTQYGLEQYRERLQQNGFEDWDTVMGITETDLAELDFKLGDRRRLQRAIREHSRLSGAAVDDESSTIPRLLVKHNGSILIHLFGA